MLWRLAVASHPTCAECMLCLSHFSTGQVVNFCASQPPRRQTTSSLGFRWVASATHRAAWQPVKAVHNCYSQGSVVFCHRHTSLVRCTERLSFPLATAWLQSRQQSALLPISSNMLPFADSWDAEHTELTMTPTPDPDP